MRVIDQPEAVWTDKEYNQVLYQWDKSAYPIHEYWYIPPLKKEGADKNNKGKVAEDGLEKEEEEEYVYLDLDMSENQVHIVEFYEPWCPHCQDYKEWYIDQAIEIQRRTIGYEVTFHGVSCTLNEILCDTYDIDSYPTILGWKGTPGLGSPTLNEEGIFINEDWEEEVTVEKIASMMGLELAEDELPMNEQIPQRRRNFSKSEDQRLYEEEVEKEGRDAALTKTLWMEYTPVIGSPMNAYYHDAAVSLIFALKSGVYPASTKKKKKKLDGKRAIVLRDFIHLVDWATPLWWNVRTVLIQDLKLHLKDDVVNGKGSLIRLVRKHQISLIGSHDGGDHLNTNNVRQKNKHDDMLWGYIQADGTKSRKFRRTLSQHNSLGGDSPHHQVTADERLRENMEWTYGCSHSEQQYGNKGYTCGLWHLFHILSVGATKPENQLYGFQNGYDTSSQNVAETIKNFIEYFFGCEVCRSNYLKAYNNCAHDHCTRLTPAIPLQETTDSSSSKSSPSELNEITLWLWEVHNSVNIRLMTESAERHERNVTQGEVAAGKFPTEDMCSKCWVDNNMETFDREEVIHFLNDRYWPKTKNYELDHFLIEASSRGEPLSLFGFVAIALLFFLLALLFGIDFRSREIKNNYKRN